MHSRNDIANSETIQSELLQKWGLLDPEGMHLFVRYSIGPMFRARDHGIVLQQD